MKIFDKNTNNLIAELGIEEFLRQGGKRHYEILFKEEAPSEILTEREIFFEFTKEEISNSATDHIYKFYPLWKQININSFGTSQEKLKLKSFVSKVIEWTDSDNPQIFDSTLENILP